MTGKRMSQKEYYHNTLYPGGARHEKFSELNGEASGSHYLPKR